MDMDIGMPIQNIFVEYNKYMYIYVHHINLNNFDNKIFKHSYYIFNSFVVPLKLLRQATL